MSSAKGVLCSKYGDSPRVEKYEKKLENVQQCVSLIQCQVADARAQCSPAEQPEVLLRNRIHVSDMLARQQW